MVDDEAVSRRFDSRRELVIKVRDEDITRRIYKTLQEDRANSHPLDLSDEDLIAELKKHDRTVEEDLGIAADKAPETQMSGESYDACST